MSAWAVVAAGGAVGAASGVYAAKPLIGHYGRHSAVTAALATLGAALGVGLTATLHPVALAVASLVLLAAALPLSTIDAVTRTLPDRLVVPATAACALMLVVADAHSEGYGSLWRALAAAAIVFLAFTALALAVAGGLGFGDCKAAALCALPLGYLGWAHVLFGIFAAYVFAAFYIIVRRLMGGASRTVAFGPFLFTGALVALQLA